MIARPIRRPGPIPFAPFPPLADRPPLNKHQDARVRSHWLPAANSPQAAVPSPASPPSADQAASVEAELGTRSPSRPQRGGCQATYHGQGTLSVMSSVTGHHYRFEGKGCTLSIDPRDRLVLGRLQELTIHSAAS